MQRFLLEIQNKEKIELFQLLAKHLGVEMLPFSENNQVKTQGLEEVSELKPYYEVKDHYSAEDIIAIMTQFPEDKKWFFSDLQDETIFPIDLKIKKQLIDNKLYIMANPTTHHQELVSLINAFIQIFVLENQLGKVYVAPTSVKIDENNALEPDIIFLSLQCLEGVTNSAIESVPELVVEVISPSNYKKLREEKKAKYAHFGVEEYWEVYPKKQILRIEILTQNEDTKEVGYEIYSEAQETGIVESKVLDGFRLDIEKVFK